MDIQSPPTTTTTNTTPTPTPTPTPTSPIKNPDPDPKHLPPPFTNGVLKRLKRLEPRHHHNPQPVVVTYRECLKNHAASMGGHAVDGCGEFMPSMTSSPTDPTSLKCSACGCHRNFHRRDPDGISFPVPVPIPIPTNPPVQHVIEYQPHHRHHPPPPPPQPISLAGARETSISPADSPSPPPISSSYYPSAPHMLLALSSGLPAPPSENTQFSSIPISGGLINSIGSNSAGKKRFRTKFTQDQKEKMHELAERVEWKMQKKDEDLIIGICNEIGVDKGVFKVWMHNNKMTFGKKDSDSQHINGSSTGGHVDFYNQNNNNNNNKNNNSSNNQQNENDSVSSGGGNVIGTNGSSSSS